MYSEWVESKANWADGISGEGFGDHWHQKEGFAVATCTMPGIMLGLPIKPVILVAAAL